MIKSICFSMDNKSLISSLVEMREIAFVAPTELSASFTNSMSALLLCAASFPPFSKSPLAEAMARAATCGRESGRLSKITNNTPIGTVTCLRSKPSANFV